MPKILAFAAIHMSLEHRADVELIFNSVWYKVDFDDLYGIVKKKV